MSDISPWKAIAFQLAPKAIKAKVLKYAEDKKLAHWQECFKTKVSKEEVDDLFSHLALDSDVMIHSSLPDIGNIRLKHITDNLKKYVLDTGHTILCPALPIKGSSLDYLKSINEFDVRTAPNAMGALSCFYGRQEGARRSMSPTHSVVALGAKSTYYTEEHHLDETPFTEKSPYFKLIVNKGKILMFGATLKNFTFNHVLEDLIGEKCFPIRVYDPRRFEIRLIDESGSSLHGRFRAHSRRSSRLHDGLEIMTKVYTLPSSKVIHIGCGEVLMLDAKDVCLCLLKNLKEGLSIYGHRPVFEECRHRADYWIDYIEKL